MYAFQYISVYLSLTWKDLETFTHAPAHGNTFFFSSLTSEGLPSCDVQAKGETEINNKSYLNIKATHLYLTSEHKVEKKIAHMDLYLKGKADQWIPKGYLWVIPKGFGICIELSSQKWKLYKYLIILMLFQNIVTFLLWNTKRRML